MRLRLSGFDAQPVPILHDPRRRAVAELRDGQLLIGGARKTALAAVERFYRRHARAHALAVADDHASRLGLEFSSLAVRDPKTRWGSCSARGNLSVSWRLAMAPTGVFDYVVVHELCHLQEPNHSRGFWRLVDAAFPGWRSQAAWLREHGGELRASQLAVTRVLARRRRWIDLRHRSHVYRRIRLDG
jgi:predicted metal-dependent hydrolase